MMASSATMAAPERRLMPIRLSISAKIVASVLCFGLIAVVASTLLVSGMVRGTLMDEFQDAKAQITRLIALSAGGAIRWKKAEVVAEAYRSLVADPQKPARAILAVTPDMTIVGEYSTGSLAASDLVDEIKARAPSLGEEGAGAESHGAFVVIAPAGKDKTGAFQGYVAIAWSTDEIDASVAQTRWKLLAALIGVIAGLAAAIVFALSIWVSRPLGAMTRRLSALADGDAQGAIPCTGDAGEMGRIAQAVATLREREVERLALEASQRDDNVSRELRQRRIDALIEGFRASVADLIANVGGRMVDMRASATTMTQAAARTSDQASVVAAASQQASATVQAVAHASENLTNSIRKIGMEVARTAAVVGEADTGARQSTAKMSELALAAQKIGAVVDLIQSIAEQTNLLALNATIEAARAGDAGKGFAVVAAEVKALAVQTAKATQEIGTHVAQIQGTTREAVGSIERIAGVMQEISGLSASIAGAIDEQSLATDEISRNGNEAARDTHSIVTTLAQVAGAIRLSEETARNVDGTSIEVDGTVRDLKRNVEAFLGEVAAA